MPSHRPLLRAFAAVYLHIQAFALLTYWVLLVTSPSARTPFLAPGAPHSTLLAFALPDLTIYLGSSLACILALLRNRRWLWPALLIHAGAAAYAGGYALLFAVLEPSRWLGALMMAPALIVPPALAWLYRPLHSGLSAR